MGFSSISLGTSVQFPILWRSVEPDRRALAPRVRPYATTPTRSPPYPPPAAATTRPLLLCLPLQSPPYSLQSSRTSGITTILLSGKSPLPVILRTWYISVCSFPIVQNYYVLIVMYRTCATCTVDVVPTCTCTGLCVHICIKLQYRLYSNVPYMYLPEQY